VIPILDYKAENSEMIRVGNGMTANTSLPFDFDSGYTAQTSQLQYVKVMMRWAYFSGIFFVWASRFHFSKWETSHL
jgi:hypothetical protein